MHYGDNNMHGYHYGDNNMHAYRQRAKDSAQTHGLDQEAPQKAMTQIEKMIDQQQAKLGELVDLVRGLGNRLFGSQPETVTPSKPPISSISAISAIQDKIRETFGQLDALSDQIGRLENLV